MVAIRSEGKRHTAADETLLARAIEDGRTAAALLGESDSELGQDDRDWLAQLIDEGSVARDRFIEANLALVPYFLRRLVGRRRITDDLMQAGRIGLIGAVDTFDWRRGVRFSTHAEFGIRRALHGERGADELVRLPQHHRGARDAVRRAWSDLTQQKRRPPTAEEIAVAAGVDEDTVRLLERHGTISRPLSLDAPVDGGAPDSPTLGDVVADEQAEFDEGLAESLTMEDEAAALLERLDDRERRIIRERFGFSGEPKTLAEVGRGLGVSGARAQQIEARARSKMRHPCGSLRGQCSEPMEQPARRDHARRKRTERR